MSQHNIDSNSIWSLCSLDTGYSKLVRPWFSDEFIMQQNCCFVTSARCVELNDVDIFTQSGHLSSRSRPLL